VSGAPPVPPVFAGENRHRGGDPPADGLARRLDNARSHHLQPAQIYFVNADLSIKIVILA
jgi:hypothetical protein